MFRVLKTIVLCILFVFVVITGGGINLIPVISSFLEAEISYSFFRDFFLSHLHLISKLAFDEEREEA